MNVLLKVTENFLKKTKVLFGCLFYKFHNINWKYGNEFSILTILKLLNFIKPKLSLNSINIYKKFSIRKNKILGILVQKNIQLFLNQIINRLSFGWY